MLCVKRSLLGWEEGKKERDDKDNEQEKRKEREIAD